MPYLVLLYYKFASVFDPQAFRDEHHQFCLDQDLKGRVFIASEGINGTVAGTEASIDAYQKYLRSKNGFEDIAFKIDHAERMPFAKLKTKVRPYILNMGFKPDEDVKPHLLTGKHLSPKEWRETLESQDQDFVLLDVRNDYECKIGHFKDAICPDIDAFSEFPQKWVPELEKYKDKKILMYCTGGIRCEKFSSLLLQNGFQDVNQLDGGILNYREKEGGKHFDGRCFVFDDRLVVDMQENQEPIANCQLCGQKEDRYVNCANMVCNDLFICCDACAEKFEACCSEECQKSPQKRPFNKSDFRIPFRSKGVVFPELGKRQFR